MPTNVLVYTKSSRINRGKYHPRDMYPPVNLQSNQMLFIYHEIDTTLSLLRLKKIQNRLHKIYNFTVEYSFTNVALLIHITVTWSTRQILLLKEEYGGFKMNMQLAVLYSSWYFFNLKSLQFSLRIFHVAHIANYKSYLN